MNNCATGSIADDVKVTIEHKECAGYEADDDTAAAYHRDDRNHGVGVAEGVEIYEVGTNEKQGDEKDRGFPNKRCGMLTFGIP